jgi:hypothetical protein
MILVLCTATTTLSCSSSSSEPASGADATCPVGGYDPAIDPAQFSTTVDNRLYPLVPGTAYTFVDNDGNVGQTIVMSDTKDILGVQCVVVHDYATSPDGVLLEDTWDYFAQDKAGNVWYFGEETKAYSGASTSTKGTWLAGLGCAKPGMVMRAGPKVGDSYRQEYLVNSAEDEADVLAVDETVAVKYGSFDHCLKTKDYTHLDPGKVENKYYCPGIGLVLTIDLVTVGTPPREELTALNGMSGDGGANNGYDAEIHDGGAHE